MNPIQEGEADCADRCSIARQAVAGNPNPAAQIQLGEVFMTGQPKASTGLLSHDQTKLPTLGSLGETELSSQE